MHARPDQLELIDALRGQVGELVVANAALSEEVAVLRRAMDELRERESRSREIMDNIATFVGLLGDDGRVELINRRILEYTGKTVEELERWGLSDLVHTDDLARAIEANGEGRASEEPFDIIYRMRRHDGLYRWFEGHHQPMRDREGRVVHWCVSVTDIDERKRAEDTLRKSEQEARLIVNSIPGLIAVLTADGELAMVNDQLHEYFGRTFEHQTAWWSSDIIHPAHLASTVHAFADAIASGNPLELEVRARRSDGVYRWLHSRALPLRDESGLIVSWYNLLVDIDDRKHAEEALATSERSLQVTIDTIPVLAWSARPDGSADFFNQHYQTFVGLPLDELQGNGWTGAVHPDDLAALQGALQGMMRSGRAGEAEARLRRYDGVYRWFLLRASPLYDASAAIVKWYGVNTDIEDRKRAEDDLRRNEALLVQGEAVGETGSFLWRPDSGEIAWSKQLYRIFEIDPAQTATLDLIASRVHPADMAVMGDMIRRASAKLDFEYEHRLLMPSGVVKHLHVVAHATRDQEGRLEYVGAAQNVTERRLSQDALSKVRSELAYVTRTMSLGVLTASIAHEVNQPLSGIITNANTCLRMLAADPPNIDGALETARRTIRDGQRASDVIARLRALFTKREFASETVDLAEAAREVIALCWRELQNENIVVQTQFEEDLPPVIGDRVQLQQVMLNLLLNAGDALRGVTERPRRICVETSGADSGAALFRVRDTGHGFTHEAMSKLFEAFYTTKPGGMGIGLSVSRSIVERHDGALWASANDGPGATFTFSLPRTRRGSAQ